MGDDSLRPAFLRPDTLIEAAQMLAEYGQRACVIGGVEAPPPGEKRPEVFIDASGLVEMTGIHQLGGKVIIGVNMPHSSIGYASLVRIHAACLVEACEGTEDSSSLLLYDLRSDAGFVPALPALAALDAEIESAWLDDSGLLARSWSPLDDVLNPTPGWGSRLLLAVRFSTGSATSGNALIFATPPPGTSTLISAVATRLTLDVSRHIVTDAKVVLAPKQGAPFSSIRAASLLRNHPPDPEHIEQAAIAALLEAKSQLSPPSPEVAYRIDLVAHLTRQALDRSLARALRDPFVGRIA